MFPFLWHKMLTNFLNWKGNNHDNSTSLRETIQNVLERKQISPTKLNLDFNYQAANLKYDIFSIEIVKSENFLLTFPVLGIDFFIILATLAIGKNRSCEKTIQNTCTCK